MKTMNCRSELDVPIGNEKEPWKKYHHYELEVDPDQDDKAKEILLCTFERPHMRAFHASWWSFHIAFFIWFSIAPLLTQIRADLGISKQEVWTSSIAAVGSTIAVRFLLGPLCDVYGARVLFSVILCLAAIPTALTGLIQSARDLVILRFFIGIAGGSFVMCQYWSSRMFTKEVVGSANALSAGWGNLGAGVTHLIIGTFLYPLFKAIFGEDSELPWRTVCIVPAVIAFTTGIIIYRTTDDAPKGNYHELKAHGNFSKDISIQSSFSDAWNDWNTWYLFIQYACCFGVELTMNNAASSYFQDEFGQSPEAASAIASIFGWLNLFARGLGGYVSDVCNERWGMRGRLWAHTLALLGEGIMVLVFSGTTAIGRSILCLVLFSLFVQAAEGTSYAIVPYVNPPKMGSVCGIVGAGGNVGAVCFGLGFRQLNYKTAFAIMGYSILGSCFLSAFIHIKGYSSMFSGTDELVDKETGEVIGSVTDEKQSSEESNDSRDQDDNSEAIYRD